MLTQTNVLESNHIYIYPGYGYNKFSSQLKVGQPIAFPVKQSEIITVPIHGQGGP